MKLPWGAQQDNLLNSFFVISGQAGNISPLSQPLQLNMVPRYRPCCSLQVCRECKINLWLGSSDCNACWVHACVQQNICERVWL